MNEEADSPVTWREIAPRNETPKAKPISTWLVAILLALTVVGTIGLAAHLISRKTCEGYQIPEAMTNSKEVGLALMNFSDDFGCYPNDETAAKVRERTHTNLSLGSSSSNDYFRQLIAAECVDSEKIFYLHIPGINRPDNVITGARCLEAGECGFTYVVGLSPRDDGATPLLLAPMIPCTQRFDPKPFHGKALVLRLDHSVTMEPIDPTGHVIVNVMDLFDPKQQFWHGKIPSLRYPAYP